MTETRPAEGGEKIESNAEKEKQEQLKRLWTILLVKNAKEDYPGYELKDILHEDEIDTQNAVLQKIEANQKDFLDFLRAKKRFEFAVHKKAYGKGSDFDGQMALWFLKKAGIDTGKPEFVEASQGPVKDKINIEIGKTFGYRIPKGWINIKDRTVIIDHHSLGSRREQLLDGNLQPEEEGEVTKISATQMVYEGMKSLGLYDDLPANEQEALKKMAQFVSQTDNLNYPGQHQEDVFKKSDKTVLGLYKNIQPDKLFEFFETGGTPTDIIDEAMLRKLGLIYKLNSGHKTGTLVNRSEERKGRIEKSLKMIEEKVTDGFLIQVSFGDETLNFLVDYIPQDVSKEEEGGIPLRPEATFAKGYDGIILYNEKTQSYFVNIHPESKKLLEVKLPQGVIVRNKMLIKDAANKNPLQISLRDLLSKLGVDIYEILKTNNGLTKAIKKNEQWMESDRIVVAEKQSEQLPSADQLSTTEGKTGESGSSEEQSEPKPAKVENRTEKQELLKKRIGEVFEITNNFELQQASKQGPAHWGIAKENNPTGKPCVVVMLEEIELKELEDFKPKKDVIYEVEIVKYREAKDVYLVNVRREQWVDASEIEQFLDEENRPERNHWGISSDPEHGKKHVILQNAPENFDPKKLLPGSKVWFTILKEIPGIIFAKIGKIKIPEQQDEQRAEAPEGTPEVPTTEYKDKDARLSFNLNSTEWTFILPDGQIARLSNELLDEIKKESLVLDSQPRYSYKIEVKIVNNEPIVIKVEKIDQGVNTEPIKHEQLIVPSDNIEEAEPGNTEQGGESGGSGNPRDGSDWHHSKE